MQREAVQMFCVTRVTTTPDIVFNSSECGDPNPPSFSPHVSACRPPPACRSLRVGDQVYFTKQGYAFPHEENHIIVSRMKNITINIILLFSYSFFRCLLLQIVHVLLFPYLPFYLLFFAGCFFITCLLRLED